MLFVVTDQQRFDTIRALGNTDVHTPNLDRLAARGVVLSEAYATCPVCVPSRYTMMSGSEPTRTDVYDNAVPAGQHERIRERCGPYLAEAMGERGYRTFGVGKFHTQPWDAPIGFETLLYSEEMYDTPAQRDGDHYAAWIAAEHPEYAWIEALMGERTEMYYMPQLSPLPAELTVESWATDRAVEQVGVDDDRPWFGFVSYIGPHPPFAPPLPYNRMYDPDRMPAPVEGDIEVDHVDQHIPMMNYMVFAEDVDDERARALKARYYGEISYIDSCVGRLLDAVDARPDADDTLICFFSDHGDLLGDHHGWQKESFFEASTHVPFLLSWPGVVPAGGRRHDALTGLADLFGIATSAAGEPDLRQGADVLGQLLGTAAPRTHLFGYHGRPGTEKFKAMVRRDRHKLIWHANGGRSLLFDLSEDPHERYDLSEKNPELTGELLDALVHELRSEGVDAAFDGDELHSTEYRLFPRRRVYQFDGSRGVSGFPTRPADVVRPGGKA